MKQLLLASLALGLAAPLWAAPPGDNWKLTFNDEFDGKNADLDAAWNAQNGPSGHILCSRWRENAVVENGVLRLLNKKENRGGQEWTSASIWTKKKFKYGYFECRYRYAAATGTNNSFWLITNGKRGENGDPGQFEIDINEGHYPDSVNMNIHKWSGVHSAQSKTMLAKGHDLAKEFHVYGLVWSETELIWYFDGREIRREENTLCHSEAPVYLSSAIIKWAGAVTDAIDGTAMEVDYVRVYEQTAPAKTATVKTATVKTEAAKTTAAPLQTPSLAANLTYATSRARQINLRATTAQSLPAQAKKRDSEPPQGGFASLLPATLVAGTSLASRANLKEGATAVKTPASDLDFNKLLQPLPLSAKFSDPDYYIWCGSAVKGDDGKYHLYYSRWLRKLGFNAWVTHSEIAHAVSDTPFGPYKHADVALAPRGQEFWDGLCTHNPTIQRFGGKYYLYYMGNTGDGVNMKGLNWTHRNNQRIGVAVADKPEGPWARFDKPLIAPTPGFFDALCCANPSVTARPGGGYLMVYKAVGDKNPLPFGGPVLHCVATSESPIGPFEKRPEPVFKKEGVAFAAEDPFIWSQNGGYFAIVKDNAGHFTGAGKSLALFESADGFKWELAAHPLVSTLNVTWQDGRQQKLNSLERPQLLFDNGVPVALLCAADEDSKRDFSFNVQIPLAH